MKPTCFLQRFLSHRCVTVNVGISFYFSELTGATYAQIPYALNLSDITSKIPTVAMFTVVELRNFSYTIGMIYPRTEFHLNRFGRSLIFATKPEAKEYFSVGIMCSNATSVALTSQVRASAMFLLMTAGN
jgi:uncharacterized membrane protein